MGGLILWMIVGLVSGAAAWILVSGEERLGIAGTVGLGLIGSTVGGLLSTLGSDRAVDEYSVEGLIAAVIGGLVAFGLVWGVNRGPKSTV